jgi:hypothetical protein
MKWLRSRSPKDRPIKWLESIVFGSSNAVRRADTWRTKQTYVFTSSKSSPLKFAIARVWGRQVFCLVGWLVHSFAHKSLFLTLFTPPHSFKSFHCFHCVSDSFAREPLEAAGGRGGRREEKAPQVLNGRCLARSASSSCALFPACRFSIGDHLFLT